MDENKNDMDKVLEQASEAEKKAFEDMPQSIERENETTTEEPGQEPVPPLEKILDEETKKLAYLVYGSIENAMETIHSNPNMRGNWSSDCWVYYILFYNCCRFETYKNVIVSDVREHLRKKKVALWTEDTINEASDDTYEAAILASARALKGKLLEFWEKYVQGTEQ